MCCRYLLLKEHLLEIFRALELEPPPSFVSRYNLAPGEFLPAIRAGASGAPEGAALSWGLLPGWAKLDGQRQLPTPGPGNPRGETLLPGGVPDPALPPAGQRIL